MLALARKVRRGCDEPLLHHAVDDLLDKILDLLSSGLLISVGGIAEQLLQRIAAGRTGKPLTPPARNARQEPAVRARFLALHEWRRQRSRERDLSADVIVSKSVMMTLAQRAPSTLEELATIPGIGPWRLQHYGPQLLKLLQGGRRAGRDR